MNKRWLSLIVAGLLVLVTGCGSFPTSGPVERVSEAAPSGRPPGIDVAAQPPLPGASPEAIVEGFFSASESPGDGYLVARQYLTAEAAGSWRPESGIEVYDSTGQSRVTTADGSAVLRAPLVGRVDIDHVYSAVHEPDFSHNFHMTKVDGEWRIGNPGDGILMSNQRFQRAFRAVPVYYLDPTGSRLVTQPVFVRQTELSLQTPDVLVRALIGGPGTWLRPAVLDALPDELTSSGTWVDAQGVAHVSLSQEMESLSAEQRVQAAAQLLWTLSYFEQVEAVQINVNGRPLSIRGANSEGAVGFATLAGFSADRPAAPRDLYAIRGNAVIKLPDAPAAQPSALPGPVGGTGWDQLPGRLAVSWDGDRLGILSRDGQRLYLATTADGVPTLVYTGTQLAKPQFDSAGRLWTIDNTTNGALAVQISSQGKPVVWPITELATAQVVGFRISPDRTRMIVIAQFGQVQRLGVLRMRGTEQLILDGWRELPLNSSRGQITNFRDIAFISPERLLVLGSAERDPQFSVYAADIDAAQITSQGPISDVDAVGLTAMPIGAAGAVAVLTASNRGLRYEAQFRWPELIDEVSDLAYPS